jgi:hypothetical protein
MTPAEAEDRLALIEDAVAEFGRRLQAVEPSMGPMRANI